MANSFVMVEENARARTYIFPVNVFVYLFCCCCECVCFIIMRIVRHQHHFSICTWGPLSQQFLHIVCGCVDVCVRACARAKVVVKRSKLCAFLRFFSLHSVAALRFLFFFLFVSCFRFSSCPLSLSLYSWCTRVTIILSVWCAENCQWMWQIMNVSRQTKRVLCKCTACDHRRIFHVYFYVYDVVLCVVIAVFVVKNV